MAHIIEVFGWADARMLLKHYAHLRVDDIEAALAGIPDLDEGQPARVSGSKRATGTEDAVANEEGPTTHLGVEPSLACSDPEGTRTLNPQIDSLMR